MLKPQSHLGSSVVAIQSLPHSKGPLTLPSEGYCRWDLGGQPVEGASGLLRAQPSVCLLSLPWTGTLVGRGHEVAPLRLAGPGQAWQGPHCQPASLEYREERLLVGGAQAQILITAAIS